MSLSFNGRTRGNVIIVLSSFFIIMLCFSCTHTHSLFLSLSIYLSIYFFFLFYYRSLYRVTRDVFDRWTRFGMSSRDLEIRTLRVAQISTSRQK